MSTTDKRNHDDPEGKIPYCTRAVWKLLMNDIGECHTNTESRSTYNHTRRTPRNFFNCEWQLQDRQGGSLDPLSYWKSSQQLSIMETCDREINNGSYPALLHWEGSRHCLLLTVQPCDRYGGSFYELLLSRAPQNFCN